MIKINNYSDLRSHFEAFKEKQLNLVTVVSRGGLGKTFIAEETLIEEAPLVFSGHVTPLSLYSTIFERTQEEQDVLIIFDDVDALMSNRSNVALLKQLCDTRDTKTVKYFSTSPILSTKGIPAEFETNCKVLMLMNSLKEEDPNMKALLTRSHHLQFEPSDKEILKTLKTFANDKEILKFLEIYVPFSTSLNFRVYKRADELKRSGLDWHSSIVDDLHVDPQLLEIYQLIKKYKTDKERERAFSDSRATYFRKKKYLLSKNPQLLTCKK